MKKIEILLIALIVISVGVLSGCTEQSDSEKILGTWFLQAGAIDYEDEYGNKIVLTFLSNNNLLVNWVYVCDWEIVDDKLVFSIPILEDFEGTRDVFLGHTHFDYGLSNDMLDIGWGNTKVYFSSK